jgi:tetratricopeptide (TPR) repeat protein
MTRRPLLLAALLASLPACANLASEAAPLFEGTGSHSMAIGTDVPAAQAYFDQGLVLAYGFNHDESARSFAEAARLDPDCAMAWWGQAYAHGPNMNHPLDEARAAQAAEAVATAMALRDGAGELERALIEALALRVAEPAPEGHEERDAMDAAYTAAMRELWLAYPNHPDVGFLFADALINETPWELWDAEFQPNVHTLEAIGVLDAVLALDLQHPGANHFYIHAWEPSGQPWRAEAAADRLGEITPGLGHMVHMPSHIYVQVGRYEDAVAVNEIGARLDREYFARVGMQGVYHGYQAHNTHFRVWSAMYMGDEEEALAACQVLIDDIPAPMLGMPFVAPWLGMEQTVHLRFGRWQQALDFPAPPGEMPYAMALWHYGRGLALANLKRFDEARAEAERFESYAAELPEDVTEFFDDADKVMAIAREMLAGEIAYLSGDIDGGLDRLRASVVAEDALKYAEPSPWMVPTRHPLGALLLEQGLVEEAERVYREDLRKHPGNVWSLQGLTECLERSGRVAEAAEARADFEAARAKATVEVESSCYCRQTTPN